MVGAHVAHLADQLAGIVADGVAAGDLRAADPAVAGRAVLQATRCSTTRRTPTSGATRGSTTQLEAVLDLLLDGLRSRGSSLTPSW